LTYPPQVAINITLQLWMGQRAGVKVAVDRLHRNCDRDDVKLSQKSR
jgi:hypothetical protein